MMEFKPGIMWNVVVIILAVIGSMVVVSGLVLLAMFVARPPGPLPPVEGDEP